MEKRTFIEKSKKVVERKQRIPWEGGINHYGSFDICCK